MLWLVLPFSAHHIGGREDPGMRYMCSCYQISGRATRPNQITNHPPLAHHLRPTEFPNLWDPYSNLEIACVSII